MLHTRHIARTPVIKRSTVFALTEGGGKRTGCRCCRRAVVVSEGLVLRARSSTGVVQVADNITGRAQGCLPRRQIGRAPCRERGQIAGRGGAAHGNGGG